MRTKDAITHFRTQEELAAVLGITQSAISQWGEFVPKARAFQLQFLTGGRLQAAPPPDRRRSVR